MDVRGAQPGLRPVGAGRHQPGVGHRRRRDRVHVLPVRPRRVPVVRHPADVRRAERAAVRYVVRRAVAVPGEVRRGGPGPATRRFSRTC
ncbi:hypothetical protein ACRAWF_08305 [Streptomyces sp. L7]